MHALKTCFSLNDYEVWGCASLCSLYGWVGRVSKLYSFLLYCWIVMSCCKLLVWSLESWCVYYRRGSCDLLAQQCVEVFNLSCSQVIRKLFGVLFFFFWRAYPDCEDIQFGVSWKVMLLCCWIDLYLSAMCPMRLPYKDKHYQQMV